MSWGSATSISPLTDTAIRNAISQATVGRKWRPLTAAESGRGLTDADVDHWFDYHDARRYQVAGDGATDDTAKLEHLAALSKDCYLHPSLDCRVTAAISTIQSGQRWHGGGAISTANGFNHHVFDLSAVTDFTVEGIVGVAGSLGVSYSTATARFVRAVSASHRCRVLHCKITGFQSAVQFNASEHCQAIGNDIIDPAGWGINVQTGAHDAVVRDNRVSGVVNEHGIYVAGSSGNRVRSALVAGNVCTGCAGDGIKASFADDLRIVDNLSYSNTGQGIYATQEINHPTIEGNKAYSNGENGILAFTTVDRGLIERNVARLNDKSGIALNTSVTRTVIRGNIIDDNDQGASGSQYGVVITGAGADDNVVEGNTITNEVAGVRIASGSANVIGQNRYANNTNDISDAGTGTVIEHVTRGATAAVTDGGTIAHGHPKTPASVRCTPTVGGQMVSVTARGAADFTVAIKNHDNTAGSSQTIYWECAG